MGNFRFLHKRSNKFANFGDRFQIVRRYGRKAKAESVAVTAVFRPPKGRDAGSAASVKRRSESAATENDAQRCRPLRSATVRDCRYSSPLFLAAASAIDVH